MTIQGQSTLSQSEILRISTLTKSSNVLSCPRSTQSTLN